MNRTLVIIGSSFILFGIVLGALGAHALKKIVEEAQLLSFETGVRYMIYQGLALLTLGLSAEKIPNLKWPSRLMVSGTLLFSVSIFFLAIQVPTGLNLRFLGPITPIGGVLMISGWAILIKNLLLPKE